MDFRNSLKRKYFNAAFAEACTASCEKEASNILEIPDIGVKVMVLMAEETLTK